MFSRLTFWLVSWISLLCDFHVSSCGTNCSDAPVFSPSRLVVKHGDSASATCSVCRSCINQISGLETSVGDVTENGTVISWNVTSLTQWTITPMCYYSDPDTGDQCCTELPVTVYKPPSSVSMAVFNHSGPLLEGGQYTLLCRVHDVAPVQNLAVTFYRGHTALDLSRSNSDAHKPVNENYTLNVTMRKEDDGAQFWCKAELELGPGGPQRPPVVTSQKITATVHYKPNLQVASQSRDVTVTEGEALRLSCLADGNPHPSYTWTLPASRSSRTSSDLSVASVTPAHEGRYTCCARNSVGAVNVTFTLTVQRLERTTVTPSTTQTVTTAEPSGSSSFSPSLTSGVLALLCTSSRCSHRLGIMFSCYGSLAVLLLSIVSDSHVSSCGTLCSDAPVFSPSRLVVKHGDSASATCSVCRSCINQTSGLERSVGTVTENGTVISWNVTSLTQWTITPMCYYSDPDTGDQCCTELPVTVYKPPSSVSMAVLNHSGPLLEGGQYTLLCRVHDVAPVQNLAVTFYRGHTALDLSRSNSDAHKPVTENYTLNVTMRKEDDGAQFWCKAELELGPGGPQRPPVVTSQKITATVHYEPRLEVSPHSTKLRVTEGASLLLNCSAVGNPGPSYNWTVPESQNRPTDSSSLSIQSVSSEDGGTYACSASNVLGSVHVTFHVEVRPNYTPYIIAATVVALIVVIVCVSVCYVNYYKHNRMGQYNMKDVFRLHKQLIPVTST
ncbi:basement membrane-specific heparan sulfate proteoglycan core protein-like [Betta splendens]|uniref:Basement membrane-specific heparan sulfate proteoglycan core protein-like n=1 Tax=Betta splendens TaxID=158456 RepID=A0A6P7NVZ7_BETSP|nr:basement membrane-specific heparan sulfate proteoglycan core protein-like [Betta splendens]